MILAFEDLQWADSGLLDFIDYLLEWSADFPILVLALGRTELGARRPGWDPIVLAPLGRDELRAILDGLVPGLPEALASEIVARAEGIPLYAVETVRMLHDRGLLVQEGAQYRLIGEVGDLEVPETLHALVASRLDGLSADERTLLQTASVLGHSFSPAALAAVSQRWEEDLRPVLDALVTKQVLDRDDDPVSPERGQYSFLQALLRSVAYGTLSRRTRKTLHLAAAGHLRNTWPGETGDIAEVLASHYLEAIRLDPEAEDAVALRTLARETLTAAGRAAASLALGPEADRYLAQAAELAEGDGERARLYEQAGDALLRGGDSERAIERLRQAVAIVKGGGDPTGGSAAVSLAEILRHGGHAAESLELLAPFGDEPLGLEPVVRARALLSMGMNLMFDGRPEEAVGVVERGLAVLEGAQAWAELSDGLITRGVILINTRRPQEGLGVLRQALSIADDHDLPRLALRAHYNMAGLHVSDHRLEQCVSEVAAGLAIAQERGDRSWDTALRAQAIAPLVMLGRWDEALRDVLPALGADDLLGAMAVAVFLVTPADARGDEALLGRCRVLAERNRDAENVDVRGSSLIASAALALLDGNLEAATDLASRGAKIAYAGEIEAEAYRIQVEAALRSGDAAAIDELARWVEELPVARRLPLLRAQRARLRAEQAHRAADADAAQALEDEAEAIFRSLGAQPLLAAALLDRVRRRGDATAEAEGREILVDLGASRWLAELDDAASQPRRAAAG